MILTAVNWITGMVLWTVFGGQDTRGKTENGRFYLSPNGREFNEISPTAFRVVRLQGRVLVAFHVATMVAWSGTSFPDRLKGSAGVWVLRATDDLEPDSRTNAGQELPKAWMSGRRGWQCTAARCGSSWDEPVGAASSMCPNPPP